MPQGHSQELSSNSFLENSFCRPLDEFDVKELPYKYVQVSSLFLETLLWGLHRLLDEPYGIS